MDARYESATARLAEAYFKLLSGIDWNDALLVAGLREGLNKFLSNAHLALFRGGSKYHKTHFVSASALQRLRASDVRGLVWEHLVPKGTYIQEPCERRAREHALTVDFIRGQLERFWHLATVTTDEDRLLTRVRMPADWDGVNVRARYEAAGLPLVPNPFFEKLTIEA